MRICVYCSSSTTIDDIYLKLAAELGTELAARGHSLVSGGGGISSMGAIARAVRAGGGRTVGIIPSALLKLEVEDRESDQLIVTETMRERKALMDERADAFIALAGGLGTLEELLEIWVARVLRMHDKPVVVLDPHMLFAHLRQQADVLVEKGFARAAARDAVAWATSVGEALDLVETGAVRPPATVREELVEGE